MSATHSPRGLDYKARGQLPKWTISSPAFIQACEAFKAVLAALVDAEINQQDFRHEIRIYTRSLRFIKTTAEDGLFQLHGQLPSKTGDSWFDRQSRPATEFYDAVMSEAATSRLEERLMLWTITHVDEIRYRTTSEVLDLLHAAVKGSGSGLATDGGKCDGGQQGC